MKKQILGRRGLADLELRIEAKYRELARQEYERELQRLADEQGRFFPLDGRTTGKLPQGGDSSGDGSGQGNG